MWLECRGLVVDVEIYLSVSTDIALENKIRIGIFSHHFYASYA